MPQVVTLRNPSWDKVKEEQVVKKIMVNSQGHWHRVKHTGGSNDGLSIPARLSSTHLHNDESIA